MPDDARRRGELESAMRRIFALSDEDRMAVFEALRQDLGGDLAGETDSDRQIRLRSEALEAMRRVQSHLGLASDKAPTASQFDAAAAELNLGWNSARVTRAWQRFRNVSQALTGGWVPPTAAQRSLRRATQGRGRRHDDYIAGLKLWLATKPDSKAEADYDAFVREYNERAGGSELPLVAAATVRYVLQLPWTKLLPIAEGKRSLSKALNSERTELAGLDEEAVIGIGQVAQILELSPRAAARRSGGEAFPRPVATLAGSRAWLVADVVAYKAGRDFPARVDDELNDSYLDSRELADAIGIPKGSVRGWLSMRRWDKVPEPSGLAGNTVYWRRQAIERWLSQKR